MANETLGQKLRALQASVVPAFKAAAEKKDPAPIEDLRKKIVQLNKLAMDLRKTFDDAIDAKDMGMFGTNFAPDVERIRAKGDNVGRPKKERKDELAELDI